VLEILFENFLASSRSLFNFSFCFLSASSPFWATMYSCIWSSVTIMVLVVVVSVLEVDWMWVGKGMQEAELVTIFGFAVLMVNFFSKSGQVELFIEAGLAEVEEDLAGTWLQWKQ
jgi:hypothetical protein